MRAEDVDHSSIPDWGVDLEDGARPGVPMEHAPRPVPGAHWIEPEPQRISRGTTTAVGLTRRPAVFGTAQPPRGVSGLMRRAAYRIPEHRVRHWLLLLVADRVDAAEHRLGRMGRWLPAVVPAAMALVLIARRVSR